MEHQKPVKAMKSKENMEQEIKNFDRTIEESMNNFSAQPPFGMWNRISAELDAAEGIAVAATAPAAATHIQRTPWKFIAAAMFTGAVVTGAFVYAYLGNNDNTVVADNKTENNTPAVVTTPAPAVNTTVAAIEEVKAQPEIKSVKRMNTAVVAPQGIVTPAPGAIVESVAPAADNKQQAVAPQPENNGNSQLYLDNTIPNIALTVKEDKTPELETITVIKNNSEESTDEKAADLKKKKMNQRSKLGKNKKDGKRSWNYLKD